MFEIRIFTLQTFKIFKSFLKTNSSFKEYQCMFVPQRVGTLDFILFCKHLP